jgi:regulator of RNase E activity RraA
MGGPVQIGTAEVRSGDIIVADRDGVIVIDPPDLSGLAQKAHDILDWEEKVYEQVRRGIDRAEAIRQVGPKP